MAKKARGENLIFELYTYGNICNSNIYSLQHLNALMEAWIILLLRKYKD